MARTNNLTNFLNDVATAIKAKLGDDTPIPASQFDTKIGEIETVGTYQSKTINISTNGSQTITPDTGYDALSSVVINVQVPIPALQSKSYEFTENTHIILSPETGYDGFSSVELTINVPNQVQSKSLTYLQNGNYVITPDAGNIGINRIALNIDVHSSGEKDVLLFNTIQEMKAYQNPMYNDYALVYNHNTTQLALGISTNTLIAALNFTADISAIDWFDCILSQYNGDTEMYCYGEVYDNGMRVELGCYGRSDYYRYILEYDRVDNNFTLNRITDTRTYTVIYSNGSGVTELQLGYTYVIDGDYIERGYSFINNMFTSVNYTLTGLFKYYNKKDEEYFNVITDFIYDETHTDSVYYTENEEQYLPWLRNSLEHIASEEEHLNNTNYGFYEDITTNQIHLVDCALVSIYDHNTNKSYICINAKSRTVEIEQDDPQTEEIETITVTEHYYKTCLIDTEDDRHGEVTEIILDESTRLISDYYIIGEYPNKKLITSGYVYFNQNTMSVNTNIRWYYITEGYTSITSLYQDTYPGLSCGHVEFLDWHHVDTQYTLEMEYQLVNNIRGLGKHGDISGDGTFINHITNQQFSSTWLDGSTSYTSPGSVVQNGSYVPNQTLVCRQTIPYNYTDVPAEDCITRYTTSIQNSISSADNEFITTFLSRSDSLSRTQYYNGHQYYVVLRYDKTLVNNYMTELVNPCWVCFDQTTGELYDYGQATGNYHLVHAPDGYESTYYFDTLMTWYDFTNNRLCGSARNSWGWFWDNYPTVFMGTFYITRNNMTVNTFNVKISTSQGYRQYSSSWYWTVDPSLNQIYFQGNYYNSSTTTYLNMIRVNMDGTYSTIITNPYPSKSMYASYYR